jgi:hypothetical protein
MTARIFNVLIGTWLFLSAFAWPHSHGQFLATVICGAVTVLVSLASIYFGGLRYFVAVIAVMLFVTSVTSATRWDTTFWHNGIVAISIFVAAMTDRGTAGARQERELYGRV